MALISGRPISFQMDLYNPLFVPRPTVEPELFASLRPPTYSGGFGKDGLSVAEAQGPLVDTNDPVAAGGYGFGAPAREKKAGAKDLAEMRKEQEQLALGRNFRANDPAAYYARGVDKQLATRLAAGSVGTPATAGQLGDFFQYVIDHPVSLARQKSALLPIVGKDIEASRLSIYNAAVQPKHPLLGLRFKNTSGVHLSQGPITVFEGSTYAGDTRVLDVQPNEERLVSYAIDLGTEVEATNGTGSSKITSIKAVKGIVTTVTKLREEKKYRIANRSQTDRTVLIEHPNRTEQQFKLIDTAKPVEDTKEVYRFELPVKAGEEKTFTVLEERDVSTSIALSNNPDEQIRYFLRLDEASPSLKAKLKEALGMKSSWDAARRELQQVQTDLQRLGQDQDRIRKNLANTPKEAEVYETYLKKLSDQEKEIDALTAKQKKLMEDEFASRKAFEDYLAKLTD
jgi:hypothetical protein